MLEIKFYPGGSALELERMAHEGGKTKTKILRELIASATMIDGGPYQEAFEGFTEAGRRIKSFAKDPGNIPTLIEIAKICHAKAKDLEPLPMPKALRKSDSMAELKEWRGSPMTFRPKEQEEKFLELVERSDMTRAAVLRALVLGISLPDQLIRRTYSRLNQVGGLCKSIAYSWQKGPWKELERYGITLCVMAWKKLMPIHDILQDTSDTPPGSTLPPVLH